MAQKRILKRDASTGRISEGTSGDTYFSADPSASDDLTTKNYADTNITGQPATAGSSAGQIQIFDGSNWVPGDPLVQGLYAEGHAIANPVTIGGKDGSGNNKAFAVDSSGFGTVNVNGTVAVTQSTSPWVVNKTQTAGTVLGALANYGTSPGAVKVESVNAFVTNTPAVTLTSTTITGTVAVTESGTWTVQPGNTANTTAWLVGIADSAGNKFTSNNSTQSRSLDTNLVSVLGATMSKTNPIFANISDGTNSLTAALSAYGTAPTGTEVMGVNAFITNTPTTKLSLGTTPYTITVTASGGTITNGTITAGLLNFTGTAGWTADVNAVTNIASVANPQTTGSVTVTGGGVVVGAIQSGGTMGTVTASASWTIGNQANSQKFDTVYQIQTAVTSYNPSFAVTTTGTFAVGCTAAFKKTGTATPTIVSGNTVQAQGLAAARTVTLTPASTPSANDLLVLSVGCDSNWNNPAGVTFSAVDSLGNTFTAYVSEIVPGDPLANGILYLVFTPVSELVINSNNYLVVQDGSDMSGTVPGTAPSYTGIVGGIYNSSLPSPTTGQTLPIQLDAKGQQLVDLNYVAGTAVDVNSGNKSAGTLRVVLATDQPALTNKLLVTPDSVALPAHQSVNVDQWAGTTLSAATAGIPDVNLKNVGNGAVSTAAAGIIKVGNCDGSGNALTSTSSALDVNLKTSSITLNVNNSQVNGHTISEGASGVMNVTTVPNTSGGWSTAIAQALTNSATSVKGSAGQLGGYAITNPNASTLVYVFWYNNSSPTIGSTTNLLYQIGIPGGQTAHIEFTQGIPASSVIYVAASTSATSSAAPGTALVVTSLYK